MEFQHSSAFVIAARRSIFGRVGGIHRNRRIEDLAAPIIAAAIADAGLTSREIDELIIGSGSQGGNPARLIALAAGMPETMPAMTVDRESASGLDAILAAARMIERGEAQIVVAGGAESLSTAPWRVARPRSVHQQPRFIGASDNSTSTDIAIEAHDRLAERYQISRKAQDAYAFACRQRAVLAREQRRFTGEIVALKMAESETADESLSDDRDLEDLADLPPLAPQGQTVTAGNSAAAHDAAAFVVVTSAAIWERLGQPSALRLLLGSAVGSSHSEAAAAPIHAINRLYQRMNGFRRERITAIELNETSAAQALAFRDSLGFTDSVLNRDGGALARGAAIGAGSAALVVRLFSRLVRERASEAKAVNADAQPCGIAVSGAAGGLGVAALFSVA